MLKGYSRVEPVRGQVGLHVLIETDCKGRGNQLVRWYPENTRGAGSLDPAPLASNSVAAFGYQWGVTQKSLHEDSTLIPSPRQGSRTVTRT